MNLHAVIPTNLHFFWSSRKNMSFRLSNDGKKLKTEPGRAVKVQEEQTSPNMSTSFSASLYRGCQRSHSQVYSPFKKKGISLTIMKDERKGHRMEVVLGKTIRNRMRIARQ